MCLTSEAVDELHAITSAIKVSQGMRDVMLEKFQLQAPPGTVDGEREMSVTRAEAERIFADRIAALEAKLKELGWTRTIRVESPSPLGGNGGPGYNPIGGRGGNPGGTGSHGIINVEIKEMGDTK